jgi:hypothetical protein
MSDRESSDIEIFQHLGKGIPLFMPGHKNCLQSDCLLGPGPRLIKKRIYRAAVSQRLRNTDIECPKLQSASVSYSWNKFFSVSVPVIFIAYNIKTVSFNCRHVAWIGLKHQTNPSHKSQCFYARHLYTCLAWKGLISGVCCNRQLVEIIITGNTGFFLHYYIICSQYFG